MHNQYLNVTPLGRFTRSRKLHPFAVVLATGFVGIFYPILSLLLINAWLLMTIVQMKKQHSEQMEQMRRAEQQNQTAVSKVSHTLAAPLSSIHLGLQSLSEDALSRSEREAELRRLVRQSRWASRTCRRLFQLSQWIHEKPEARPQDLSVLDHLLEVLEVYEDSIIDLNIELSLDGFQDQRVSTDPGFLRDVLGALLENVVEHAGGKCKLSISTRTEPDRISIEVNDSGKGATRETLQRILGPYRLGETTGLGLAVARVLVESQGGELTLESGPEGGFKASFSLPKSRVV